MLLQREDIWKFAGSFWNMAVPEGIDFYYEITQWESGKIFHYRYLLDDNSDIIRERAFEGKTVSKDEEVKKGDGKKGGKMYMVEVKDKRKVVDPQVF